MFFLLVNTAVQAQQRDFIYQNFTQEQGLPSNETYCVFEDSKHYTWIGTDHGVVRFNGNKFQLYNLPDNVVFLIKEDKLGRIWFFTNKGHLCYFEDEQIKKVPYAESFVQRVKKIHIIQAHFDEKNNIHLNSSIDSNYIISPNGEVIVNKIEKALGSANEFIIANPSAGITTTLRNRFFMGAVADSFLIHVKRNKELKTYHLAEKNISFTHYGSIADSAGNIYFYGGRRLLKLMPDGTYVLKLLPANIISIQLYQEGIWAGLINKGAMLLTRDLKERNVNILRNKSVSSITQDFEGGLWFSTLESGVFYVKSPSIKRLSLENTSSNFVSRMMDLEGNSLVYSTTDGLYIMTNDLSSPLLSIPNFYGRDLQMDGDHCLYFGAGFQFPTKLVKLTHPIVKTIQLFSSSSEFILKGLDSIVLPFPTGIFSLKSGFRSKKMVSKNGLTDSIRNIKMMLNNTGKIYQDVDGIIWCGTKNGLYRTVGMHDSLYRLNGYPTVFDNGISCIRQLHNGWMAFGIISGGLALMHDRKIENITEKEGLLSNKISSMLVMPNALWIATANGVSVINFSSFDPLRYTINNISKNHGLFNIAINQLLPFQHQILAATNKGILFFESPETVNAASTAPLPFHITTINYYNGDTTIIRSLKLPHGKTRLLIKFNAITYTSNEGIEYLYRLHTTDTTWNTTTSQELLIEDLEPGEYQLELKARIRGTQRVSDIIAISITAEKAWWQFNTFKLLVVLLIAIATYLLIKERIQKVLNDEKTKSAVQAQLAELEQTALRSQMNPTFIFNSLQSIQLLLHQGNKGEASEYLVKFARLIRKTLEFSASHWITVASEIDYLKEYLNLEQSRLPDYFDYSIATKPELNNLSIPNLMIQPLLEHCIHYGNKLPNDKKSLISIRFNLEGQNVNCTIETDVAGMGAFDTSTMAEDNNSRLFGINTLKKRLAILHQAGSKLERMTITEHINEENTRETSIVILLPFDKTTT